MRGYKESEDNIGLYRYGAAPFYWLASWGSLPYGRLEELPRSDDVKHLPERWVFWKEGSG